MIGRLQFKHKKNICVNRNVALSKVEEMKKDSLYGEPIVIQYYENDKIELLLCIGTIDAENKHSYHIIDTRLLENKIAENVKEILRVESKLDGEISERIGDITNLTSIIEDNKQLFESLLSEEKKSREGKDSEILSTINTLENDLDSEISRLDSRIDENNLSFSNELSEERIARDEKDTEILSTIGALEDSLTSKINTENKERDAEDALINSRIDNEIVERVKGDINRTLSEKKTINSNLIANNDGTTLSFDVNIDTSCEFLKCDDGGLTDKGIKEHVENRINEVKNILSSYTENNGSNIEGIKNDIQIISNNTQEHINNANIHVTSQQKTDWQNATDAINAFLASAESGEKALDTLKELQNYIDTHGEIANNILTNVANNKSAIDIINADETKQGSIEYKIKENNNAINDRILSLENEDKNIKNSIERNISDLNTNFENEINSLKREDISIKEHVNNNVNTLSTRIDTEVSALTSRINNEVITLNTNINTKADASALTEEIHEREVLANLVDTKVDKNIYESKISSLESNDEKMNASINTLNELVGKESVATQISKVVNDLHFNEEAPEEHFVINIHQNDGRIDLIERLPFSSITENINVKIGAIDGNLVSHSNDINSIKNDITSINSRLDENDSKHSTLEETINVLKGKDDELGVAVRDLGDECTALQEQINTLNEALSSKTNEITALNAKVTALEENVDALTNDLSNLLGRLNTMFGAKDIMGDDIIYPVTKVETDEENSEISAKIIENNTLRIDFNSELSGVLKDI